MPKSVLESLFLTCQADLQRFFRRRVSSSDIAADLTQETFLRVVRIHADATLQDPRAYLFRTANNLVIDHYKTSKERHHAPFAEDDWQALRDPAQSAEALVLTREELNVVRQAIDELPPRGRTVFVLHKFDGLSYADIGARLGIAKNTVVVHMVRSLAHCKRRLAEYRQSASVGE